MKQLTVLFLSLSLIGAAALLGGCTTCTNCGVLQRSHEVTILFSDKQIVPNYNYYHNGPVAAPNAIIGIDNRLQVEGRFWTPVAITQEQLNRWMREIDTRSQGFTTGKNGRFDGFEMLDVQGRRVGVWYSNFDWGVFKFPDDSTISIYAPSVRPGSGSFSINN